MRSFLNIVSLLLVSAALSSAQSAPPRIFFSDLESGANTGGQNNKGVWVTIWGKGFGATQGTSTVTVGGGAADNYPLWSWGKCHDRQHHRERAGRWQQQWAAFHRARRQHLFCGCHR